MTYHDLDTLAKAVDAWCRENGIRPLSGQAAEVLTLRSLRYYRTLGLLDGAGASGYGELHFHQLAAVRVLQSKGQPLKVIQTLLYGRTLPELQRVLLEGQRELAPAPRGQDWVPGAGENWSATSLAGDWLLISRRGQRATPEQLKAIQEILSGAPLSSFHS